jgi:hypothetical protein
MATNPYLQASVSANAFIEELSSIKLDGMISPKAALDLVMKLMKQK